ncbi:MAG: hypothetical protein H6678_13190 [Candidatus Delongbacteria bacterium]|nr:hypothetical protein [Candidatus Delongbacteria bacterium]
MLASLVACSDRGTDGAINQAPTVRFELQPTCGSDLDPIQFDPRASTDDQSPAESLRVRLDWEGDGIPDTEWLELGPLSHRYPVGDWWPAVEIRDEEGMISTLSRRVRIEPGLESLTLLNSGGSVHAFFGQNGSMGFEGLLQVRLANLTQTDYQNLELARIIAFDPEAGNPLDTLFYDVYDGIEYWNGELPAMTVKNLELDASGNAGLDSTFCGRTLGLRILLRMAGCGQSHSLETGCAVECLVEETR